MSKLLSHRVAQAQNIWMKDQKEKEGEKERGKNSLLGTQDILKQIYSRLLNSKPLASTHEKFKSRFPVVKLKRKCQGACPKSLIHTAVATKVKVTERGNLQRCLQQCILCILASVGHPKAPGSISYIEIHS